MDDFRRQSVWRVNDALLSDLAVRSDHGDHDVPSALFIAGHSMMPALFIDNFPGQGFDERTGEID